MGLPTVVIASEDFEELARSSAQALGLPEARILTVAHPIGGVADEILRQRAESSVEQLMSLLGANVPVKDGE
jgi:hypothetical protein